MRARYEKRAQTYTKRLGELDENKSTSRCGSLPDAQPLRDEVKRAVDEASKEEDWWSWQLKANEEKDLVKRESVYRDGLQACPKSAELADWFAIFLYQDKKDSKEAEVYYRKAMELNPRLATAPRNLANLLWQVKEDYKGAEELYKLALELDQNDVLTVGSFAAFLTDVKEDHVEAEKLFRRSLDLSPHDAFVVGNFAWFLGDVKKNYDEAERLYRLSASLDPTESSFLGKLAALLAMRGQLEAAYEQAMRAVEVWDVGASQSNAAIAFGLWLLSLVRNQDGTLYLGWLKTMIGQGFRRGVWTFDDILPATLPSLSEAERSLANKIAVAIAERGKEADLLADPLWQATKAIPLSETTK